MWLSACMIQVVWGANGSASVGNSFPLAFQIGNLKRKSRISGCITKATSTVKSQVGSVINRERGMQVSGWEASHQ